MGSDATGNENIPPAELYNATPAEWFSRLKKDGRLSILTLAVAREISTGRPLSLIEFADAIGCGLRSVSWALDRLARGGHIRRHRGGGRGRRSCFDLLDGRAP